MEDQIISDTLQQYLDSITSDKGKQEFIEKRILAFDEINKELKQIQKALREAKKETLKYYKKNPKYSILYGTDMIKDSLDDIKTLLNIKE
jgi:hypothetical protein